MVFFLCVFAEDVISSLSIEYIFWTPTQIGLVKQHPIVFFNRHVIY